MLENVKSIFSLFLLLDGNASSVSWYNCLWWFGTNDSFEVMIAAYEFNKSYLLKNDLSIGKLFYDV